MKFKILQLIPAKEEKALFKPITFIEKDSSTIKSYKALADTYKDENGIDWETFVCEVGIDWIHVKNVTCWALVEQGKETHIVPMCVDVGSGELKSAEEIEGYFALIDDIQDIRSNEAKGQLIEVFKELLDE